MLLAAFAQAMPFSPVAKVHLLSYAMGPMPALGEYPGLHGSRSMAGSWSPLSRVLDAALGVRLSPQYAVAAQVIASDRFFGYYGWDESPLALGLTVVRCTKFGPKPKAIALTASVRGSNGWDGLFFYSDLKYLDLGVGANITCWAVNPELEVGFRREWNPGVSNSEPSRVDCVYAVARVGLGGWYELESTRAKWDRHETGAWPNH